MYCFFFGGVLFFAFFFFLISTHSDSALLLLLFALLVSLSRVVVAAHWLSDVLGSIAIAFLALNAINEKVFRNILYESKVAKFSSFFLIGIAWAYIILTGTIYEYEF